MSKNSNNLIGNILCRLGFHQFKVIEVKFGFGTGGQVEIVECARCGYKESRQAK